MDGRVATKTTETTISLRALAMLAELEEIMRQEGIGLRCIKCEALGRQGVEAAIHGDSVPGRDTFRLVCGCSVRIHNRTTGKVQVIA